MLALSPTVSAACTSTRTASTYNPSLGTYAYWYSSILNSGALFGQTWQLGSYGTWNDRSNGPFPPCYGSLYSNGYGGISMDLYMSVCGTGCPDPGSTLAYLVMNSTCCRSEFLLATSAEDNSRILNFDYSQLGHQYLIPIPRPRVTSSSRAGTKMILQVAMDATSGGAVGVGAANAITGYTLLTRQAAIDPGRKASYYTTTPAALPVEVDCTDTAQDHWLVTQIIFENGAVGSDAVSVATRVGCTPNLADPTFRLVHKKPAQKAPAKR